MTKRNRAGGGSGRSGGGHKRIVMYYNSYYVKVGLIEPYGTEQSRQIERR